MSAATAATSTSTKKPILVIGATGHIGRQVVALLLAQQPQPVRALVRNIEKARQVLDIQNDNLSIVVVNLAACRHEELEGAVQGCSSIISVSGTLRVSKWRDFLPWRLFGNNGAIYWLHDESHPYCCNYQSHRMLCDLARQHDIQLFVRVTGLSVGWSAFHPICILACTLLSMTTKYHYLTEQWMQCSDVPYVIIRPGGLVHGHRDVSQTHVQVAAPSAIPAPGKVYREDVAALCVALCHESFPHRNVTLGIRNTGSMAGLTRHQGTKEEGCPTVEACLQQLTATTTTSLPNSTNILPTKEPPYALAVAMTVYSLVAILVALVVGVSYCFVVFILRIIQ